MLGQFEAREFISRPIVAQKGNTNIQKAVSALPELMGEEVNRIFLVTDGQQTSGVSTEVFAQQLSALKEANEKDYYYLVALSDKVKETPIAGVFDGTNKFVLLDSLYFPEEHPVTQCEQDTTSSPVVSKLADVSEKENGSSFNWWWLLFIVLALLVVLIAILLYNYGGLFLLSFSSIPLVANFLHLPEWWNSSYRSQLLEELKTNVTLRKRIISDSSYISKWANAQKGRWYADPALNPDLRAKLAQGNGTYDIRGYAKQDPAYEKNALMTEEKLLEIQKYMPEGVQRNPDGTVDFTNASIRNEKGEPVIVDIGQLRVSSNADRIAAQKILEKQGFKYPQGFDPGNCTWHHIEGTTKLMLVRWDVHALIDHIGGRSCRLV